jgi:hypothetical protein
LLGFFFHQFRLYIILTKRGYWLQFGRFFNQLIWSPCIASQSLEKRWAFYEKNFYICLFFSTLGFLLYVTEIREFESKSALCFSLSNILCKSHNIGPGSYRGLIRLDRWCPHRLLRLRLEAGRLRGQRGRRPDKVSCTEATEIFLGWVSEVRMSTISTLGAMNLLRSMLWLLFSENFLNLGLNKKIKISVLALLVPKRSVFQEQ